MKPQTMTITCSLCSRTIDGVSVKVGRPPIIEGFNLGVCKDCQSDPSCNQCRKHPLLDNVNIVGVEGDDITNDTRWCTGCIGEFQSKGFDVYQTGKRPKRKTPVVPAENTRPKDAPVLKLLQGGKAATDDAPIVHPPIRQVTMRDAKRQVEECEMSIANVFRSTQKASKAIRRASSAWYQES